MYCSLHSHSQLRTEQYLAFYTTRRDTLGSATAAINGNVKNALNKTTVFNELHCIKREPKNLMVFNKFYTGKSLTLIERIKGLQETLADKLSYSISDSRLSNS